MYIDFHVHAFADVIAERAIGSLEKTSEGIVPCTRGTVAETEQRLTEWGVDKGVILPIATKPSQQTIINNWASKVQASSEKFYCFGSVHPEAPDVIDEIERIKFLGLKGVKLHPDYQNFLIDEERLFPIYKKCADEGLPVIFHAGFDPLSPDLIHAVPKASLAAHRAVPEMTMILAHFGGMNLFNEVEEYLVGEDIYLDLAITAGKLPDAQAERIIKNHGADRILLASDCPWDKTPNEIDMVNRLNLSEEEKEWIFHLNAEKLLGI